jgi:hypothetical protein
MKSVRTRRKLAEKNRIRVVGWLRRIWGGEDRRYHFLTNDGSQPRHSIAVYQLPLKKGSVGEGEQKN